MIIVDTSVWIDHFNGKKNSGTIELQDLLLFKLIGIGDLILSEILQGFNSDRDFYIATELLSGIPCFSMVGTSIALRSSSNFRLLREKGIAIRKTIDMLIGTFCIENRHTLFHNDRDFDHLEKHLGLSVYKTE